MRPSASRSELAALLAAALAARLLGFVGATDGDAGVYAELAARPLREAPTSLPAAGTAIGRFGVLVPTRAAFLLWGPGECAAAVYPLLCSLGMVGLAWVLGRRLAGPSAGLLAGAFVAICPHQVAWGTVLGADIPAGFWLALAGSVLWGRSATFAGAGAAGAVLGIAVATRESSVTLLPFALLWAFRGSGGWRRALALLAAAGGALWLMAPDGRIFRILWDYVFSAYLSRAGVPAADYAEYLRGLDSGGSPWRRWLSAPMMLLPGDHRFRAFAGIATLGFAAALAALRRPGLRAPAAWALAHALFLLLAASPSSPGRPVLVAEVRYLEHVLVPAAVLAAWALGLVAGRWRAVLLGLWIPYLAYAGWVGVIQARGATAGYRELAAWLPEDAVVYGSRTQIRLLRFLKGFPERPVLAQALRYDEYREPGGPYRKAELAPGALFLDHSGGGMDPGMWDPVRLGWAEVRRWKVVTELGPRARLAILLGKPLLPMPERKLVLYRVPAT